MMPPSPTTGGTGDTMDHLGRNYASSPPPGRGQVLAFRALPTAAGFSSPDLIELLAWQADGRYLVIEPGMRGDAPDQAGFALVYRDDEPWASWGISRQGMGILMWDCVTHADIGRFDGVQAALDALPTARRGAAMPAGVAATRPSAEVIPMRRVAQA